MYFTVFLIITLCVIILINVVIYLIKIYRTKRILSGIPAPHASLFIGNLLQLLANPDLLFLKLRDYAAEYYPIYRFSTFDINIVNLLDPDDIELFLSTTKHLSKSKIYTFLYQWLGTGLLTSTGTKWHTRRKILTPAFHFTILEQFITVFHQETVKLIEQLNKETDKASINVIPFVTHFTLQSIAETAMGLDNIEETTISEYRKAIHKMGEILLKRLSKPWLRAQKLYNLTSLGRYERTVVKILHNFSNNVIKQRQMKAAEPKLYGAKKHLAMLDLLLAAKQNGANIDDEGIREEVDTFMFEGHDTTAMAISFLLLTLANQPEAQERVRKEIFEIVGETKRPTYHDLQELKYTERCIKETLRLFPSVPFISRFAGEDFHTTTGFLIPKGTIIHLHIFDIHRNPRIYPEPLKFDPDRFLPENVNQRHPFAYIPFSAGPRNCIGQRFALLELKTVLCGILRSFVLEPIDRMYDVKFKLDIILRPSKEIKVKFRPLSSNGLIVS